ncbi:MAG: 30S ribosomal protein S12 methylthiotransferase RimO [Kiritimatiellia bacterium]|nr:30S ribosomal protein S12 methylthiotransferase RimO [Kiritimatiellia bacterium]
MRSRAQTSPIVSLISLGCAKNTVDSERILAGFVRAGWLFAEDPSDADLCLVNTCGFIADAREESRKTLKTLAQARRRGRPRKIVALGCLVERAATAPETGAALFEADARVGFADYARLPEICGDLLADASTPEPATAGRASILPAPFHEEPRLLTGAPHFAWLKISEGCSNRCAFCSIPLIRGRQVSRAAEDIVREARQLADSGVKEIALIAQDTTSYGWDRPGEPDLAALLARLSDALDPDLWLRVMYAHPKRLTDDLLRAMRDLPNLCPYLDLPLQHISDPMLRSMGRGMTRAQTLRRLDRIREIWPEAVLRTTFIAGYPGETEADVEALLDLIREGRFLHAGVFAFSPEPGTRAERLPDRVPVAEAERRRNLLLLEQQQVSRKLLAAWIGREIEVLIDGPSEARAGEWVARARWQAPEVDGVVRLSPGKTARRRPGPVRPARILRTRAYDLIAELCG